jgi:hypothetical protein
MIFVKGPEIDFLLRVSFTNQISDALNYAGLQRNSDACFIIFSKNANHLNQARNLILRKSYPSDITLLRASKKKKKKILERLGIQSARNYYFANNDQAFLRYLTERAALILK